MTLNLETNCWRLGFKLHFMLPINEVTSLALCAATDVYNNIIDIGVHSKLHQRYHSSVTVTPGRPLTNEQFRKLLGLQYDASILFMDLIWYLRYLVQHMSHDVYTHG